MSLTLQCLQNITALMFASSKNASAAVDYLLSIGADVNRQNKVGEVWICTPYSQSSVSRWEAQQYILPV
jgi:ankyrin repeat protein